MSAPWASMWLAQECRRTWGLTTSPRPTRSARWCDHGPGPLPAEPAPRGVEEDGLGVAAPGPAVRGHAGPSVGGQPPVEGHPGRPPERDQPLLGPLAEHPEQAVVALQVHEGETDHLGDAGPGAVEHLEQGPVPEVGWFGPAHRVQQLEHLVLVEGLGQPAGDAGRPEVGGGIAGRSSPSLTRNRNRPRRAVRGPGHRRRVPSLVPELGRGGARWPRCRPRSGRPRPSAAHCSHTAMSRR